MKTKHLTNLKIIEKQDKNLNTYYIIFNQDTEQEAYFCFNGTVKEGWEELKKHWPNITEIEFEYEELEKGNKVVNILTHNQSVDIFV